MKTNIKNKIAIEINRDLGYPIVFMESPKKNYEFLAAVKDNLFAATLGLVRNRVVDSDRNADRKVLARDGAEICLMAKKIATGFLPLNLFYGSTFAFFAGSIVEPVDKDVRKLLDTVASQIKVQFVAAINDGKSGIIQMDIAPDVVEEEVNDGAAVVKAAIVNTPVVLPLTKEDCHCSVMGLYENVARKLGYEFDILYDRQTGDLWDHSGEFLFDRRMLCVTGEVRDEVFAWYEEHRLGPDKALLDWKTYGPAMDEDFSGLGVYVGEEFIIEA